MLYRSGSSDNFFANIDGDEATSNVIVSSFLVLGINTLIGDKKAFINFTKNLLIKDVATLFPKEYLVVEILENVEPDKEIIEMCKKLKKSGVLIALDDFIFHKKFEPLIELADIIKIDFLATNNREKEFIVKKYAPRGIKFLAEKVETEEDFQNAVRWGYTYFQGYYFSKPTIIKGKDIPVNKVNCLNLINSINEINPSIKNIAKVIEKDVSLSYEILKLVNSVAFSRTNKITSINQALVMIGLDEIKKWAYLVVLRKMGDDKPLEVIKNSLIRAKFSEFIAEELGLITEATEYFLMGMFSFIDVLMDRPIEELLENLPFSNNIKDTLLGKNTNMSIVFHIIKSYERGEWLRLWVLTNEAGLLEESVARSMYRSFEWANNLITYDS